LVWGTDFVNTVKAKVSGLLVFSWCVFFSSPPAESAYFGEVKTGLQNVAGDRYGYSLYIPEEYTPDRSWPLVIALHDRGGRGEELIQAWVSEAKQRGFIVFCPTYEEPRGEALFDHDKRLLKLKQEIQSQYEIDAGRILIAGSGIGGHYAFYLGLRYPKEFSAVVSIGNAVTGTLENGLPILTPR
jgi:predicted peptidase